MRRDDHLLKTMSAAKVCIAECLKAPWPADSLAKYLAFLRSDPEWSDDEVAEVESTAQKAIDAVAARTTTSPNCGWSLNSQNATPISRS
jgi:hypothetical protein